MIKDDKDFVLGKRNGKSVCLVWYRDESLFKVWRCAEISRDDWKTIGKIMDWKYTDY